MVAWFASLQIIAQNLPPVAVNDTIDVLFNTKTTIQVVDNDYDSDGGQVRVKNVFYEGDAEVSFGTFSVYYKGLYGFEGDDSLQYVARDTDDPEMYDTAWVFVTVQKAHFTYLDINNIRARVGKDAEFFYDRNSTDPGFEVPVGSQLHSIYALSPWIGGYSETGLKLGGMYFGNYYEDHAFSGPISTTDSYLEYSKWDRVWKINRSEIEYHINHYTDAGYSAIDAIKNWPAHGDVASGESFDLAPFHDENLDGIYDPMDGDFPEIKGDQSVYIIYNYHRPYVLADSAENPIGLTIPFENILKTEIHIEFYAFDCEEDSALNHSVFAHINWINRSDETILNTQTGFWADLDIGSAIDDFIETDVMRNSIIAYNGDSLDNSSPSSIGYGSQLPAQSVTILKGPKADHDGIDNNFGVLVNESVNGLNFGDGIADNEFWGMNYSYFGSTGVPNGDFSPVKYYHALKATHQNGQPLTYGGNGYTEVGPYIFARFQYPNDSDPYFYGTGGEEVAPWSISESNYPADRKGYITSGPVTLGAGESIEMDFAFVYARDYTASGNVAPIPILKARIDSIQAYFNAQQTPCGSFVLGLSDQKKVETPELLAYPNPFSEAVTFENPTDQNVRIRIYNLLGQSLKEVTLTPGKSQHDLSDLTGNLFIAKTVDAEVQKTVKLLKLQD